MRLSRNKKIILGLALMIFVGLIPLRAHAGAFDILTFLSSATGIAANDSFQTGILHFFLTLLTPIQSLVLGIIGALTSVLSWVINLHMDTGGQAVYAVWKILRDLCNMTFIVVIIVTSFGTIFNVFKLGFLSFYNIYNPKLVRGFLIAAIFINFSLAIGQSVVALSNHVTDIIVGFFPSNIGGQIASELHVIETAVTHNPTTNVNFTAPGSTTATIAQTGQSATLSNADKVRANIGWDNIFIGNYLNCVNTTGGKYTNASSGTLETCYARAAKDAVKFPYPEVATAQEKIFVTAGGNPPAVTKVGGFLGFSIGGQFVFGDDLQKAQVAVAENLGKPADAGALAAQVMGTLYSIFLLMVLALSFLVVVFFMLIRIPIMWVILALSPLAWVGLLTSDEGLWKDWWKQFMAWNYFTPLYLGMIYLGLYLLSQQPNLINSLTSTPGSASAINGQIGVLLFYIMTGIIFIGGTGAVVKFSFAGGETTAKSVFGGITSRLGIDDKRQGAIGAVYRGIGLGNQVTGATQRLQQIGGDIRANISGRIPNLPGLRTSEEALAAAQKRYGVRGGDKAYAEAVKKRVDNQQDVLKANKTSDEALEKMLGSGNRDAALAAGEILLAKGKLSNAQIEELGKKYSGASDAAKSEFQKRVTDQIQKGAGKLGPGEQTRRPIDAQKAKLAAQGTDEAGLRAVFGGKDQNAAIAAGEMLLAQGKLSATEEDILKKKSNDVSFDELKATAKLTGKSEDQRKFLQAAMAGEIGQKMRLDSAQLQQLAAGMTSPEDQRAFLESATKVGRNKVAAIETLAGMGLMVRRNGTKLTADEALADRAAAFSADDWLDAEEYSKARGGMSPAIQATYEQYIQKPPNLQRMLRDAGTTQAPRIKELAMDLAQPEAQKVEKMIQEKFGEKVTSEVEQRMASDRDAAERANVQLGKLQQGIKSARQKIADESRLYRNSPSKQNRDKIARAAIELRNSMRDLNAYKTTLTK